MNSSVEHSDWLRRAAPALRFEKSRSDVGRRFAPCVTWFGTRGITAVIPEPDDQIGHRKRRGARGGRPPAFDATDYKGRNVIERGINTVKQWRGLATRYDKLAIVYRGAAVLRAITLWLKRLGDTP